MPVAALECIGSSGTNQQLTQRPRVSVRRNAFESYPMQRAHSLVLLDIAPRVAETFRTDPEVADLLEPAVFVGVAEDECAAAVVERIQLTEVMSGVEFLETIPLGDRSSESVPIAILVMDKKSATFYHVADPRTDPALWPWLGTGREVDQN